jgi:hypothetical protein
VEAVSAAGLGGDVRTPKHDAYLRVSGRFRPLVHVPGVTTFGDWSTMSWDNQGHEQYGARIVPDHAPWRDLFQALDAAGESLSDAPASELEEADAIVATCWRYGSYVHALSAGELYPDFRTNPELSRLSDGEMKRINLEFSSGLAAWWTDRDSHPARVNRRVRAAVRVLPMPWTRKYTPWLPMFIRDYAQGYVGDLAPWLAERHVPTIGSIRDEANAVVSWAYRNGAVEGLHGGHWSHGTEIPGFVRLYAGDLDALCRSTVEKLAIYLTLRARPEAVDIVRALRISQRPPDWSVTEETSTVDYAGMPGAGSLGPRLGLLAERYPSVYGSVRS